MEEEEEEGMAPSSVTRGGKDPRGEGCPDRMLVAPPTDAGPCTSDVHLTGRAPTAGNPRGGRPSHDGGRVMPSCIDLTFVRVVAQHDHQRAPPANRAIPCMPDRGLRQPRRDPESHRLHRCQNNGGYSKMQPREAAHPAPPLAICPRWRQETVAEILPVASESLPLSTARTLASLHVLMKPP